MEAHKDSMIGRLSFNHQGVEQPSYILDAAGNLLRCTPKGDSDGLIPFASELVATSYDLQHPKPWTISLEMIQERLKLAAGLALTVYPSYQLARSQYPFVDPDESAGGSEETIDKALALADSLAEDSPDKLPILVKSLAANGVHLIPDVMLYLPTIHDSQGLALTEGQPVLILKRGWMSSSRVFRKSIVQSLSS